MSRYLALGLAAAALVAAGCGGTSKDDYEDEINRIGETLDEEFTQIGRELQASGGLANAADEVREGAEAYDAAAAELEDIEPPEDAEEAHAKIVAGVELLADDLRVAARAAAADDAARVQELFADLESREGYRRILEAREELETAGYAVE
jgi:hypothetical protein